MSFFFSFFLLGGPFPSDVPAEKTIHHGLASFPPVGKHPPPFPPFLTPPFLAISGLWITPLPPFVVGHFGPDPTPFVYFGLASRETAPVGFFSRSLWRGFGEH